MIAVAIASVPCTITGEIAFGRMCENRILGDARQRISRQHEVVFLLREHRPS